MLYVRKPLEGIRTIAPRGKLPTSRVFLEPKRYPNNCPTPPHPHPEENCPPVRVGVWVKVRVSFRVGGQPENCPREKLPPG